MDASIITKEPNYPNVLTKACTNLVRTSLLNISKIQVSPDQETLPPKNNISLYCSAFTSTTNYSCNETNCQYIFTELPVSCSKVAGGILLSLQDNTCESNISICYTLQKSNEYLENNWKHKNTNIRR